jgi:hypothetical protein
MATAAILAILLAAVGPIWLPFAFAKAGRGAVYAFCLTNLITLLPMAGLALWREYLLPPSCRHLPCEGIPTAVGWFFITLLFYALAFWSLLATVSITTSNVFRKR